MSERSKAHPHGEHTRLVRARETSPQWACSVWRPAKQPPEGQSARRQLRQAGRLRSPSLQSFLARNLGYITQNDFKAMESLTSKLHAKLQAFINGKRRSAASRIVSPVSRLAKPAASLAGFTLVEMLAVVTLIFILIGVSLSLTRIADRKARESRARADIKAIENALELYKADYGGYPPLDPDRMNGAGSFPYISTGFYDHYTYNYTYYTSISWMNTISLYQALTTNGPKTYLAFKPDQIKGTNISGTTYYYLVDPWDNPYGYNPRDPQVNGGSFDIWSAGPDWYSAYPCKSNQVDDIGNWTK